MPAAQEPQDQAPAPSWNMNETRAAEASLPVDEARSMLSYDGESAKNQQEHIAPAHSEAGNNNVGNNAPSQTRTSEVLDEDRTLKTSCYHGLLTLLLGTPGLNELLHDGQLEGIPESADEGRSDDESTPHPELPDPGSDEDGRSHGSIAEAPPSPAGGISDPPAGQQR